MAHSSKSSAPSAMYKSPSGTHTFTVPAQSEPNSMPSNVTQTKIAHLSALRASTKQLQSDINAFLTAKMEEDKVSAAAGTDKKSSKSRDEEEEENYGEEKVEDD